MKKIGLCLSGGGIKGAGHIGALKAMEEENIKFSYISGTSSGSIVATLYAIGYSPNEIYLLFKKYGKKIKYIDIKNIFKGIYGLLIKRRIIIKGLNNGKVIENIVNEACRKKGIKNIKEIKMPLLIPSVNLKNGAVYIFCSKGVRNTTSDDIIYVNDANIGKAVRSSCSFPVVFEPCFYMNKNFVDGGIRENIPWKETKKIGAEKVISIVFENELKTSCCSNFIDVASRSLEIMEHELANYEVEGADYLLKIRGKNVSLLDIEKMDFLYKQGYEQTKNKIHEIKKFVEN